VALLNVSCTHAPCPTRIHAEATPEASWADTCTVAVPERKAPLAGATSAMRGPTVSMSVLSTTSSIAKDASLPTRSRP
jgi:hypothetical protein